MGISPSPSLPPSLSPSTLLFSHLNLQTTPTADSTGSSHKSQDTVTAHTAPTDQLRPSVGPADNQLAETLIVLTTSGRPDDKRALMLMATPVTPLIGPHHLPTHHIRLLGRSMSPNSRHLVARVAMSRLSRHSHNSTC